MNDSKTLVLAFAIVQFWFIELEYIYNLYSAGYDNIPCGLSHFLSRDIDRLK